jgi:hypothetical protein
MDNFLHGFADELVKLGAASDLAGTNYVRDTKRAKLPAPGSGHAKVAPTVKSAPKPKAAIKPKAPSRPAWEGRRPKDGNWEASIRKRRAPTTTPQVKPKRFRETDPGPSLKEIKPPAPVVDKKKGGKGRGGGKSSKPATFDPNKNLPWEGDDARDKRVKDTKHKAYELKESRKPKVYPIDDMDSPTYEPHKRVILRKTVPNKWYQWGEEKTKSVDVGGVNDPPGGWRKHPQDTNKSVLRRRKTRADTKKLLDRKAAAAQLKARMARMSGQKLKVNPRPGRN